MQKAEVFFRKLVSDSKNGDGVAICSVCSSNELVLEAALEEGIRNNRYVLIEATANQVNQYGGYTGMTPDRYFLWVSALANRIGLAPERLILGGDNKNIPLPVELAAQRTVRLVKAAEESTNFTPVYVIGSEVPAPGGAVREEEPPQVTDPQDLQNEYEIFHREFTRHGLENAWNRVIAIVAQPGVEFGDNQLFIYNRMEARRLIEVSHSLPGIVLEGHSTDYQPSEALQSMREDGIAILKVGPALTFSLRRALFALEEIEKSMYPSAPVIGYSEFSDTLEMEMISDQRFWQNHYRGDNETVALMRKYSLSDRCRYYFERPAVRNAIQRLFLNIDAKNVPCGLVYQYFPEQAEKIISGKMCRQARAIAKEQVCNVLRRYE